MRNQPLRILILVTIAITLLAVSSFPQDVVKDSTAVKIDYTDGPHVVWQNDTTAIVVYVCGNTVIQRAFYVRDTLQFNGLCQDSSASYLISAGAKAIEQHIIDNAPKILAVSDIHGEYEYFVDILQNSGVIDSALNWAWGDGHLVIVGDVFDRGDKVTECLWLIYRLEQQASPSGGKVHYLLGNHELMVLQGDNRYVHERYLDGIAKKTRIRHEDLYGPDTELGRWLRSKHTAVKLNGILFVHGGISPFVVERGWSLTHINKAVREKIDLRSSQIAFDSTAKLLLGNLGPFWYRGYHYGMDNLYQQATVVHINSILNSYNANTIVVGHTDNGHMVSLYENRVYGIDVDYEELGCLQALLWRDNRFLKVDGDGRTHPID